MTGVAYASWITPFSLLNQEATFSEGCAVAFLTEDCLHLKRLQRPHYRNSQEEYSTTLTLLFLVHLASWKISQKRIAVCTRLGNLVDLTSQRYLLKRRTSWIDRDIGSVERYLQKLTNTLTLLRRVQVHRFAGFVYSLKTLQLEERSWPIS